METATVKMELRMYAMMMGSQWSMACKIEGYKTWRSGEYMEGGFGGLFLVEQAPGCTCPFLQWVSG